MAFQIIKENTANVWQHSFTDNPDIDFIISAGWFNTVSTTFRLFSNTGGEQRTVELSDIEVIDNTDTGTPETFATPLALATRLKALNYPYF